MHWYLIHTKWASEPVAESNLLRQGYQVYLPRLVKSVKRRGRWREQIVALFPRYLFLGLKEGSQVLGPVRSTTGVANVVRFGATYATVPDQLIASLMRRADAETGLHRLSPPALPAPGTRIRLADGPFDGLEGMFECESGEDRAVVLLDLLGRKTRVQVPVDHIRLTLAAAVSN